ncbi:Copia type Polyprotein [Phytophthora megakarya]|uniref:Copia type Polyprotein n=1 Tax=Phytophthora megakarya TaxID=4795 RepID=A0A225W8Q9_9STRA|nr:Copia type Polyprotein [Phytophthora megakarya]
MVDGNVLSHASRKQVLNALTQLSWTHPVPLLLGDNQGAISMSAKPGKHSKSKHIEYKHHMVRRNVELKRNTIEHVGTEDMVADIMAKALEIVKFTAFRKTMNVQPIVSENARREDSKTTDEAGASTTDATVVANRAYNLFCGVT